MKKRKLIRARENNISVRKVMLLPADFEKRKMEVTAGAIFSMTAFCRFCKQDVRSVTSLLYFGGPGDGITNRVKIKEVCYE